MKITYNPVEAAVPTGYDAERPGLLETGIGTIALVEASGTTAVEMDLTGTTGAGVPVGATVTVKYTVAGAGHEVTAGGQTRAELEPTTCTLV